MTPNRTAVLVLALMAGTSSAVYMPRDGAKALAWQASDIVVTDTAGKVVEVWKGGLKVGDALPVGDSTSWPVPVPQVVRHGGAEGKKVSAERVIMFLRKAGKDDRSGKKPGEWLNLHPQFLSAGNGGVYTAPYAPEKGVPQLYTVVGSEKEFKAEMVAIAERRTAFDAAMAEPDQVNRAKALRPFATEPKAGIREAIAALPDCGEAGVEPLAAVLFKKDWGDDGWRVAGDARREALPALVKIGKPAAGELTKFLELQVSFWTLTAPDLQPWWRDTNSGVAGQQLQLLYLALADPEVFADLPAERRGVIRDLHAIWTESKGLAGTKTGGLPHPAKIMAAILTKWEKK